MKKTSLVEPLIQAGMTCLKEPSKFVSVCCRDGAYEFNIKHSGKILAILLMFFGIPFIIAGIWVITLDIIFYGIVALIMGLICLLRPIFVFSKRTILRMNPDHTVQIINYGFLSRVIYDIPKGQRIDFTTLTHKKTYYYQGKSVDEIVKILTVNNARPSGISHPYVFMNYYKQTIEWLERFFHMLNASSWLSCEQTANPNQSCDPPWLFIRVYDPTKYDHAMLTISYSPSMTPVLHTMPSFNDHQYTPAPSKYHALQDQFHNWTNIGNDAYSQMFRVLDKTDRPFGIKVCDFVNRQSKKEAKAFEREVNTLQSLRFNGIPEYYDLIDNNPLYYIVEEYIPAPSMTKRILNGERISLKNALTVLTHIAEILNYLESMTPPVIHRHITPNNILIDDDYNVWLVGFNITTAPNPNNIERGMEYRAPEQLTGAATHASDIYSVGLSMLLYFTGKPLTTMKKLGSYVDVQGELPSTLPTWFKQLMLDMTAPIPENRLSRAASIIAIIQDFASESSDADGSH